MCKAPHQVFHILSPKLLYELRGLFVPFQNAEIGVQGHVGDRQMAVLDLRSVCGLQAGAPSPSAILYARKSSNGHKPISGQQ